MTATSTDVAVPNGRASAALAIRPGQEMFNDKQRAALAVLGIKDATNADLAVYMHYCQKTGLDPFSRQIYMIARREKQGDQWITKQTIQVGIDGFRVIRDRIARREGITVEYEDTIWYDAGGAPSEVWLSDEPPTACKVVVVKDGRRFPGVVRTAAYAATNREGDMVAQWRTQPDHMIEKCAEAFALRRAFPNDLGGIYLEDELPPMPAAAAVERPRRVTAADITGQPEPPGGPTAPAAETASPAPDRNTPPSPPQGQPAPATLGMTRKLEKLLESLPLGPDNDVRVLLEWLCGGPYTATRGQVRDVTAFLEDHLRNARGDTAEAASAIWDQHRAATAHDAAEAAQDTPAAGSDA